MENIGAKFKDMQQIKWDNKYPVEGQLNEFKACLNRTNKLKLALNDHIDEITEIAQRLRDDDSYIEVETVTKREKLAMRNAEKIETFHEDVSSAGILNILSLGLTRMFTRKFYMRTKLNMNVYDYSSKWRSIIYCENKKLTNFRHDIWNINNIDQNYVYVEPDYDNYSVLVAFHVKMSLFERGYVQIRFTYDIECEIINTEQLHNVIYRYDVEHYMKQATDIFINNRHIRIVDKYY